MTQRQMHDVQALRQGRRKALLSIALLLAFVLASAFANVYSTHACRELYAQLQRLEEQQWHLQEDHGRLLLERSTWAAHHRIETVARDELGMAAPDLTRFRVVQP